MFKGSVYCRRWIHEGKKQRAWGIRYSVNGGAVKREIVMEPIRFRVESNLVPYFGTLPLEEIDAEAIDGYVQTRKAGGVTNATCNRDVAVLRHMLRLAVASGAGSGRSPISSCSPRAAHGIGS